MKIIISERERELIINKVTNIYLLILLFRERERERKRITSASIAAIYSLFFFEINKKINNYTKTENY